MSDYGENKKQICFESKAKLHADLKIRLHYDEIKIKEFFNEVVTGYINKNKNMMAFIDDSKRKKRNIADTRRNKVKKSEQEQENTIRQFALDKNDIENIFDILEKEHPDL